MEPPHAPSRPTGAPSVRRPRARWQVVALIAVAFFIACVVVSVHADLVYPVAAEFGSATGSAVTGVALGVPGALLLWRLGPHPMALVLTGAGALWGLDGPAVGVLNAALATGSDSALASAAFWFYVRGASVLSLVVQLVLVLFPDGRLPTGRWRPVGIAAVALAAVLPLSFVLAPAAVLAADDPVRAASLARFDPGILELTLPEGVWGVLLAVAFPCTVASAALALAVVIGRRRGASAERRAQLRWLSWAGIVFCAMLAVSRLLPAAVADIAFSVGVAFVSVSIVIAVTRHRLYAIDRLLSWTIVYGVLVAGVVIVDVGLYLLVGSLFDERGVTLVAVLLVVVIYTPLRDRLHRLVSRWINGTRADPYEVVSQLADRLEFAGSSERQLDELALSLARAFASPYVRVELDRRDGTLRAAQTGTSTGDVITLPLTYEGRETGRILMQPGRRPAISERDRRLLGDIVRLAAAALSHAELGRELQIIREGLVAAREEERARLRRELHDGLGPLLAGIRLRLETARNLAERDPDHALAVLDSAIEESSEVVAEIRRLVHELRPPALDDLGLARAIAQQGERLAAAGFSLTVDAPRTLTLTPAVEVAAYRIASEALTNIAKHANAQHAHVRLATDDGALVVDIADDGAGMDPGRTAGVGLASLRERATELGGTLEITRNHPGTRIRAILPDRHGGRESALLTIGEHP